MRLLTVNTGSSSLKLSIYRQERPLTAEVSAHAERIGLPGSRITIRNGAGNFLVEEQRNLPNHDAAFREVLQYLRQHGRQLTPDAIGHRLVHGAARYDAPQRITPELIAAVRKLAPIAPDHLPQALAAIDDAGQSYPGVPQVACFDTTFHRHMPRIAQMYPLPRELWDDGVSRYGFHGISCESIMHQMAELDPSGAAGRVIIAHLGNGASMTAIRGGISIDNTMGFTPAGGLMMGTRSGDMDPGVLLYLLESKGMSAQVINGLVNHRAGLLGVSKVSEDTRDLLAREAADPCAAEAIDLFCYQAKKFLGAFVAVLGGVDTLVFTAGIGEHAVPVRARICQGFEFAGIRIHPDRNSRNAPVISPDESAVTVRVMKTNEDLMIARHVWTLLSPAGGSRVRV